MCVSSRLRVLVIGVGSIGERHLRCFAATDRVELAICEVNQSLGRQVAERYGVTENYAELEEALHNPPRAAVVATPAHLHIPMAMRLAEAGTHLLIEKPLSISLNGVDALIQRVRELDLRVAVAYVYRQHPALQAMKSAIDSGRFGKPLQLVATCGQHFPTYRPAYREIYYANRATGGGAIQDALPHVLNAAEWLLGPIDRLAADADHLLLPGVEVEDTVHLIARHGSVMAAYSLNQHQAPNESTITVVCERGTCRFEFPRHRWMWMTEPDTPWQTERFSDLQRDDLFVRQAHAFLDCVERRTEPACSLEEAEQTLRATLALLESVETGQWKSIHSPHL